MYSVRTVRHRSRGLGDWWTDLQDTVANATGTPLTDSQIQQSIADCQQQQLNASNKNTPPGVTAAAIAQCKGLVTQVAGMNNNAPPGAPGNTSQWLILGAIGVASLAVLMAH